MVRLTLPCICLLEAAADSSENLIFNDGGASGGGADILGGLGQFFKSSNPFERKSSVSDILPGDFFQERKTVKFGASYVLQVGSNIMKITVTAETDAGTVNTEDYRHFSFSATEGSSLRSCSGSNDTKMTKGSSEITMDLPVPGVDLEDDGDDVNSTTKAPGTTEQHGKLTLNVKARAEVSLPWGQTAVPCFGSAGSDGAWYLLHQFQSQRLSCVVYDADYAHFVNASHPSATLPGSLLDTITGDVVLAIRKRVDNRRGYRVESLAHGLPYILQWRGVQRGMQCTTASISDGCGGFCVFSDETYTNATPVYTVDDTYRVKDLVLVVNLDPPTTTEVPACSTTTDAPLNSTTTEAPLNPTTTEAPVSSTTTEGPVSSTTTEAPASSTSTEAPGPTVSPTNATTAAPETTGRPVDPITAIPTSSSAPSAAISPFIVSTFAALTLGRMLV